MGDKNQDMPDLWHNSSYHYMILLLFFKIDLKMERYCVSMCFFKFVFWIINELQAVECTDARKTYRI